MSLDQYKCSYLLRQDDPKVQVYKLIQKSGVSAWEESFSPNTKYDLIGASQTAGILWTQLLLRFREKLLNAGLLVSSKLNQRFKPVN